MNQHSTVSSVLEIVFKDNDPHSERNGAHIPLRTGAEIIAEYGEGLMLVGSDGDDQPEASDADIIAAIDALGLGESLTLEGGFGERIDVKRVSHGFSAPDPEIVDHLVEQEQEAAAAETEFEPDACIDDEIELCISIAGLTTREEHLGSGGTEEDWEVGNAAALERLIGKARAICAANGVEVGPVPERAKPPKGENDDAYIAAARQIWATDELEIDDEPVVSVSDDGGAWVAAWVWVSDEDAGLNDDAEAEAGE